MNTKNINTNGTKNANWQAGEQLDAGFSSIGNFFQYLDRANGDDEIIHETVLDNLYKSVTSSTSSTDFSKKYGKNDGKVNTLSEFRDVLRFLENRVGQDIFKFNTYPAQAQAPAPAQTPVQAALSFITFEHTTGGFKTNQNSDPAKAAEFKAYIEQMWHYDPDFRDLMEQLRLHYPNGYVMELADLPFGVLGRSAGSYLAIDEKIFNRNAATTTIIHEIFHSLGLGHRSSEHGSSIPYDVPGINSFEASIETNNVFYQAINGKDDGLTKESYNFSNPNNKYDLDLGSGDDGIYGGS